MKLINYTVEGFYKELASDSPAPGGGSTAAVEASFGCGLIAMVCELTIRNKKFADEADKYRKILKEAHRLGEQVQLTKGVPLPQICVEHNVSRTAVQRWTRLYRNGGCPT